MNIIIVDDEKPARERLKKMLVEVDHVEVVAEAVTGDDALEKSQRLKPDVVLLDIRMPGMDGIEAAAYINKLNKPPAIVFTTAYSEHTLQALKLHAIDYLLKPIKQQDLVRALQASKRMNKAQLTQLHQTQKNTNRQKICVSCRGNLELIKIEDIYYFLADNKYVTLRTAEQEYLIEEPLKSLEQEFERFFIRIHRNAIVAKNRLHGITKNSNKKNCISFGDINDVLEISRRHLADVRAFITEDISN